MRSGSSRPAIRPSTTCLATRSSRARWSRPRGGSFCEFKGEAGYLTVVAGTIRADRAGWFYARPAAGFEGLRDRIAVYPAAMDRCLVDGEVVRPQEGGFYGGWITSRVVGPFKGAPGTSGW